MQGDLLYEHARVTVSPLGRPVRLDYYLFAVMRNKSRTTIQEHIKAGKVRVNDLPSKASYKVKEGDRISWMEAFRHYDEILPMAVQIPVVYETDELIVLEKPAGMPMHPGLGNPHNTLLNALQHYYQQHGQLGNLLRDALVQRIDKGTTGLVVLPKTAAAKHALEAQFLARAVQREYYALVWGNPEQDYGTLSTHMGRTPQDDRIIAVSPDGSFGKPAVTHFQVLKRYKHYSLLRCKLETGRTHQIRVHMHYMGHPLVGDERYFIREKVSWYPALEVMQRHALHARLLGFFEPATGRDLLFESELPEDFRRLMEEEEVGRGW